ETGMPQPDAAGPPVVVAVLPVGVDRRRRLRAASTRVTSEAPGGLRRRAMTAGLRTYRRTEVLVVLNVVAAWASPHW
ncbi:MAG TPA: hypothetical protein VFH02_06800, partial [Jiangellaceae bacterium]|nr:hypothetical protein [Jiangellaceae bacterium]